MLILENLISRYENKNSRDLVENSSRIGITRLTLGFGRCTLGHRKLATSEPAGTSANRRRQVADVDVIKNKICRPRHRWWRRCGGRKTSAASNDVKTGRRQQLIRQLITARVQVIASMLSHTSAAHFKGYNPGVKQTCIRNTIARPPTSSSAAAALKGCSRLRATTTAAAPSWAARLTRGRGRVT